MEQPAPAVTQRELFATLLDAMLRAEERHLRTQTMLNAEQADDRIRATRRLWLMRYDSLPGDPTEG